MHLLPKHIEALSTHTRSINLVSSPIPRLSRLFGDVRVVDGDQTFPNRSDDGSKWR